MAAAWRALSARLPHDRALIEWFGVCILTLAITLTAGVTGTTRRLDNLIFDAVASATAGPADDEVVIVGIDDRSLETLGRWPWPREIHARAIDQLHRAGAEAVAYDILFPEPDFADPVLAAAMERAGNVYLPVAVEPFGRDGGPAGEIGPDPRLRSVAAGIGHVNLVPDADGVVRRMPLSLRAGDRSWPHLLVPLLETARSSAAPARPLPPLIRGDRLVVEESVLLRWRGPSGSFRTVAFVDVLGGEVPPEVFAGRIVLVGMTASGQGDRYATPLSGNGSLFPGVELQATLLNTLLEGDALRQAGLPLRLAFAILPLLVALGGFLILRPGRTLLLVGGLIAGALIACAAAIAAFGLWLPPSAPILGLALSWPLWSWRRLAAASAFMKSELEAFERSGDALTFRSTSADVVGRQVEAMKAALQRLRDLRQFISDTLQSLPDATLVFDAAEHLVLFNEAADRLLGGALSRRADPTPLYDLLGVPGLAGMPHGEVQVRDGRFLHISESALVTRDGVYSGRVLRLGDVSEIRVAQRQREQALQLLSHDMRAPQAAILALLEQAGREPANLDTGLVAHNARRTIELADAFVQLARAENQPLQSEIFDLASATLEAADGLWPLARRREVELVVSGGKGVRLIRGDRHLIVRALCNLIDNAIKFSPPGGAVRCVIRRGGAGSLVAVAIEDEGAGVPPELRSRLFEPFQRGWDSGSAIGLGLALVDAVARRHGGRVDYTRRRPRGSRFVIALPAGKDRSG